MGSILNWPHSGTHRATGPLTERDLDAAQLRRVLPATAQPCELVAMQRHAADAQALRLTHQQMQHALNEVYDPQPAVSACNGNCNQGRMCDCVAGPGQQDDDDDTPRTRFDAVNGGFWRALLACALVAVCLGVALSRG